MPHPTQAKALGAVIVYSEDRLRKRSQWWSIVLGPDDTAPFVHGSEASISKLHEAARADYPDIQWVHAVDLLVTCALRNTPTMPLEAEGVEPWSLRPGSKVSSF